MVTMRQLLIGSKKTIGSQKKCHPVTTRVRHRNRDDFQKASLTFAEICVVSVGITQLHGRNDVFEMRLPSLRRAY